MIGIDPNIINHALNIDPKFPPKQQKRRPMDDERKKALKEEVDRLRENKFIREAYYPEWIGPASIAQAQWKMEDLHRFLGPK